MWDRGRSPKEGHNHSRHALSKLFAIAWYVRNERPLSRTSPITSPITGVDGPAARRVSRARPCRLSSPMDATRSEHGFQATGRRIGIAQWVEHRIGYGCCGFDSRSSTGASSLTAENGPETRPEGAGSDCLKRRHADGPGSVLRKKRRSVFSLRPRKTLGESREQCPDMPCGVWIPLSKNRSV